jgi:hypothetical protein
MTSHFECNPSDPGDMLMEIVELKRQNAELKAAARGLMDAVQMCMDKDVGVRRYIGACAEFANAWGRLARLVGRGEK